MNISVYGEIKKKKKTQLPQRRLAARINVHTNTESIYSQYTFRVAAPSGENVLIVQRAPETHRRKDALLIRCYALIRRAK